MGVNCWKGKGISELLHQSQPILSGEKGKVFQELVESQILKLLQSQSNSIFGSSFETIIKQAVLSAIMLL